MAERNDKNYIEYRPDIRYVADEDPTIKDERGNSISAPQQQLEVPVDLTDLQGQTSGDVLAGINQGLGEINGLIDQIAKDLTTDVANGVSFPEYIAARKSGDFAKASAYESAHQESIDGSNLVDAMPALLDSKGELEGIRDIMHDRFYGGAAPKDLGQVIQQEKEQADALIQAHLNGGPIPIDQVRMDNNLRGVISDRVDNVRTFTRRIGKSVYGTLDRDTGGNASELIQAVADTGDHLGNIQQLNQINFEVHKDDLKHAQVKMDRLMPVDMRLQILKRLNELQQEVMRFKGTHEYLSSMNSNQGTHPASLMLAASENGLQRLHQSLIDIFLDAHRFNMIQDLQNETLLGNLDQKRVARQMHKLMNDVSRHYDRSSQNSRLQADRIARLQK